MSEQAMPETYQVYYIFLASPGDMKQEWAKVDVILMVFNAAQAARHADVQ
jgi:hypothetical protein